MGILRSGESLPNQDHVSRFCKTKFVGEYGRPLGTAFMLRPGEDYLSVNWLEYFGGDREAQLGNIRRDFPFTKLKPTDKFAVLNVGETLHRVNRTGMANLSAIYKPSLGNPSHSGIYGCGHNSHEADSIANVMAETVLETCPAKQPT